MLKVGWDDPDHEQGSTLMDMEKKISAYVAAALWRLRKLAEEKNPEVAKHFAALAAGTTLDVSWEYLAQNIAKQADADTFDVEAVRRHFSVPKNSATEAACDLSLGWLKTACEQAA